MNDTTIRDELLRDLQETRAKVSETPSLVSKRSYTRRSYSRKPSIVLLLYTFVLGMLFFPALSGEYAYFASFMFVLVAFVYSILRE